MPTRLNSKSDSVGPLLTQAKKKIIATHANSKFPLTHSKYKTSHFLIATRILFLQFSRLPSPPAPQPSPRACRRGPLSVVTSFSSLITDHSSLASSHLQSPCEPFKVCNSTNLQGRHSEKENSRGAIRRGAHWRFHRPPDAVLPFGQIPPSPKRPLYSDDASFLIDK